MFWSWWYVCFLSTLIFSRTKFIPSPPLTGLRYVSQPASEWSFLFCGEKVCSRPLICTFYYICTALHCFLLICVVVRGGGPGCGLWWRMHGVQGSVKFEPNFASSFHCCSFFRWCIALWLIGLAGCLGGTSKLLCTQRSCISKGSFLTLGILMTLMKWTRMTIKILWLVFDSKGDIFLMKFFRSPHGEAKRGRSNIIRWLGCQKKQRCMSPT